MPCLTTWAHSCSAVVLPMRTTSSPKGVQKQSHGCSCQGCKATNHTLRNPPEPSGTCLRNLHQRTPEPEGSGTRLNLRAPAHTGTLRNLPPEPTCTSAHRNPPEPSGTRLRNLHQRAPEPAGTFWNLPPELAPATRTGARRSLSGLKTPLSLRCSKKNTWKTQETGKREGKLE